MMNTAKTRGPDHSGYWKRHTENRINDLLNEFKGTHQLTGSINGGIALNEM